LINLILKSINRKENSLPMKRLFGFALAIASVAASNRGNPDNGNYRNDEDDGNRRGSSRNERSSSERNSAAGIATGILAVLSILAINLS
jgi:hypothetical protein